MEDPSHGKRIGSLKEFKKHVHVLTHVAVKRGKSYFHHYLVIQVHDNHVIIVHYAPGTHAVKQLAVVSVTLEKLRFDDPKSKLLDFKSGLFFIDRENYPKDVDEKLAALFRIEQAYGECQYSASSNNCETFVRWVLTGKGECEQFEQANQKSRFLVDCVDSFMDIGKKVVHHNLSEITAPASGSTIAHVTTKSADKLLNIAVAKSLGVSAQAASKVGPSAIAAGVSTEISAAVSLPIETVFCVREILQLKKQRKEEKIDKNQFKRQVTKKVSGSASAVAVGAGGGFLGAFVGQIVIPIPVLGGIVGGAIGGVIGNLVGRAAGSTVSGQIYDVVTD